MISSFIISLKFNFYEEYMIATHDPNVAFVENFVRSHYVALPLGGDPEVKASYAQNGFVFYAGPFIKTLPSGVTKEIYLVAKPAVVEEAINRVGLQLLLASFQHLNIG